ncbi:TetR/AcrR family transcriptional regulator [Paraburkholderia sp. A1RI-2L]|uniref:TetR/AcrR family transcriptional regulator n=1 Tax=Paraburkholderia sp. A1RI-2L TaxID=3028367 RepID=UPI003B7CAB02
MPQRILDDYKGIVNRSGVSATRRCTELIERIFHDANETDLPKFLFEIWAFAQHESYVADLVDEMYAEYRGIFAKLLKEIQPTLNSEECFVRASILVSQTAGMMIFAYQGGDSEKDFVEFVRLTKRAVKMIVGMSAQTLEFDVHLQASLDRQAQSTSSAHTSIFGSEGHLTHGRLELGTRQSGMGDIYCRPTVQGKHREIKVNEIVSCASNLLMSEGYANFTLARVSRELGILPSALQNYFPTHDDLLRSTIGALLNAYLERYEAMGKPSGKPALERLCEIVEDVFEEARDPQVCRVSFELFALAQHSEMTRELVRRLYAAYRAIYVGLVREIDMSATARECLARATLIAAQVEGAATLTFGTRQSQPDVHRIFELLKGVTIQIAYGNISAKRAE